MIDESGGYIEVYVATPLEVCEQRDVKGLYARVRKGEIKNFTGIDDPYEAPQNPELTIDTTDMSIEFAVSQVISFLSRGQREMIIIIDINIMKIMVVKITDFFVNQVLIFDFLFPTNSPKSIFNLSSLRNS